MATSGKRRREYSPRTVDSRRQASAGQIDEFRAVVATDIEPASSRRKGSATKGRKQASEQPRSGSISSRRGGRGVAAREEIDGMTPAAIKQLKEAKKRYAEARRIAKQRGGRFLFK